MHHRAIRLEATPQSFATDSGSLYALLALTMITGACSVEVQRSRHTHDA
jgi:hypothetical protein